MALDANRPDLRIGIVGTGVMGQGIAQIAAAAGASVTLFDTRPEAAETARRGVVQMFGKLAEKGKLTAEAAAAAGGRLRAADSLTDMAAAHVVVEAIVENIDAKRALFAELEGIVGDDCLLATNTSSLSVTAIAAGARRPGRIAGLHFFNPVPLMRVVEVIPGLLTEPEVTGALVALTRRMGHHPARAKDTPGFLVNHASRGYGTEALRILGEGIADETTVDRIMREAAGFRMGPLELFDLTGLDVSHPVMESIYHQFYEEPRFRPSPITAQRLAAGLLGRKSGRGFYRYDGTPPPAAPPPPPAVPSIPVWTAAQGEARAVIEKLAGQVGCALDGDARPGPDSLCIIAPVGEDATTTAVALGLDATRTVALDPLFGLAKHRTLMTTPVTNASFSEAAHGLLASDGAAVSVIHDSPGFVAQRIAASIVNVACDIAQQRIATPEDIDRAVTLGLGYPEGPLAMGDRLGAPTVLTILEAMHRFYGDPRYRPSPWLKRRAMLGVSLTTPEA